MAKKRKSEATRLDEIDRTMYSAFRGAANSLSQLYTHAMSHQRLSFLAGERRALEKLHQWIVRQQEEGTKASTVDIIAYLQNELQYEIEEDPISPTLEFHQSQHQTAAPPNSFSSGLSSPVRRTLQQFNLAEASNHHLNSSPGSGNSLEARPDDSSCQDLSR
ncbi:PREDICTED: uncharacterized protein LOC104799345 [Tarenaya hassleriana]|uniref:uncharacterized protein LOC104799345 n=1 Tax=Tarenaya hassleriana TaxID=28532 RepID=UPI00053C7A9B|nr:PREDICTED: uncharacterized protein LOC104799345 [Tarenaya hassleriana]